MARALLAWELGEGVGHCANLLSVARVLLEYGWEVEFASKDPDLTSELADGLDVRILPAPAPKETPSEAIRRAISYPQILHNFGFAEDQSLQEQLTPWRDLLRRCSPELVVFEHAPTALLASRWHACRRVVAGSGFCVPPSATPCPMFHPSSEREHRQASDDETKLVARVNRILAADGLAPIVGVGQLFDEADAALLFSLPELDHSPQRTSADYFAPAPLTGGATPEWPDHNGQRVFCYLKSPDRFSYCGPLLAALCAAGLSVLAHVRNPDPSLMSLTRRNLRITADPVDIDQAARECAFAVTNGGLGVVSQLLISGTPQMIVPMQTEQWMTGRRITQLGAGLVARASDAREVVAALSAMISNPRHRRAAARFSERYAGTEANDPSCFERRLAAVLLGPSDVRSVQE